MRILILFQFLLFSLIICSQNNSDSIQPETTKTQITYIEGDKVYLRADSLPTYPGGIGKMHEHIMKNLKYPREVQHQGIEGRTIIQVIISKSGKMSDPRILRSSNPSLDKEALRVVKMMNKKGWTPAKLKGNNVNIFHNIAISFRLGGAE